MTIYDPRPKYELYLIGTGKRAHIFFTDDPLGNAMCGRGPRGDTEVISPSIDDVCRDCLKEMD